MRHSLIAPARLRLSLLLLLPVRLENVKLDELAAKRVHEFALIVEPLKIRGGTGSTVAPIAVC